MSVKITPEEMAKYIDQTNLKPETKEEDMRKFFEEAKKYGFAAVAILPVHVKLAKQVLKGSDVKVDAAVGFPLGSIPPELKEFETKCAVEDGADEIDMVINNCAFKSGKYDLVKKDIEDVVRAAGGRTVKVIIEAPLLTDDEIKKAAKLAEEAGADFVKTSTGFKGFPEARPATFRDVKLIREATSDKMKLKASGGIHTARETLSLIIAGASRIGASRGVDIVEGTKKLKIK